MRSNNPYKIVLCAKHDEHHLESLASRLTQGQFKVLQVADINVAVVSAPSSDEEQLIYVSRNAQDFPFNCLQKLNEKFKRVTLYLDQAPDTALAEKGLFTTILKTPQDPLHANLIKHIGVTERLTKSVPDKAHDILSVMADAVIAVNEQLRIEYMNPIACQLVGASSEDLLGKEVELVLDLRDPDSNKKITRQLFERYQGALTDSNPEMMQSQYLLLNSSNQKKYKIAARNSTYYNAKNGIESVVVLRDITNKPNISQKFPASDNKYWALVNTTQLGYTILDKTGKVVDANDEFLRITGQKEQKDIINIDAREWIADHEKNNIVTSISQLMKDGRITGMEVDFKSSDGTITPIEFNATVIRENGDYYLLGIGRDISDRRRSEHEKELIQTQLRQAQKMEAIGQLTGGIAHDFNNVLASILGYTELSQFALNQALQNPYESPIQTNKKLESYLDSIHEAGTRARDLIQQLMVFSRGSEIAPQHMKIEPAVNEIMKLLSSTLPKTIEVSTQFEKELPFIHIDPIQLHQVIMNLCINSRDALGEVGEINIAVCRRKITHKNICASCHNKIEGDYIDITIQDNGPGIPDQHRDRIFEPFYTTKTVGQGTGMGLSMVHGIVHEHGGHILLGSHLERGTATHLLFPIKSEPTAHPLPAKAPANTYHLKQQSSGHIVIIEDEESLASFLNDLFTSHGYRVTTYTDSCLARQEIPQFLQEIDIILTDHTMPGITGAQLAKEILEIRPSLPIILCTGFSFKVNEKTAYSIGISRFLRKPVSSNQLLREVDMLLKQTVTT